MLLDKYTPILTKRLELWVYCIWCRGITTCISRLWLGWLVFSGWVTYTCTETLLAFLVHSTCCS